MTSQALLNYTIIRKLGEGGMGEVYLALNPAIQQYVAIKRLHSRYADNPAIRERFRQEAIMLSSLSHPNIVRFLNYVENESGVFLIMEYVDGCTLEEFINNRNGLIVEERAVPMIREMLDAFSTAHQKGIIHRDIKPSNIYVTNDGHIKVIDFGIAQIIQDSAPDSGEAAGTPEYMSPEQVLGRPVDKRSDIYSLGVLIHQMLTGHAPYDTDSMSSLDVKRRVISVQLPPMKNYYPYISDRMQELVNHATEKDPNARYTDCFRMIEDLPDNSTPTGNKSKVLDKRIIIGIVAASVLLASAIALWIWDFNRLKVQYYSDYIEKNEIPEGVGRISSRDLPGHGEVYKMEFRKGKLRKLIAINGNGDTIVPRDMLRRPTRHSITEYYYNDEGIVDLKKVYDNRGKMLYKLDYESNLRSAAFKYDDEYGTPIRVGTLSKLLMKHDTITGYLTHLAYADVDNRHVKDKDSVTAMELEYHPTGRLKLISYLDSADNPISISSGYSIQSFEYDDKGLLESIKFYDVNGRLTANCDSISMIRYTYNSLGTLSKIEYLGTDMKPRAAANGVATTLYSYDNNGRETEVRYFDISEKQVQPSEPTKTVLTKDTKVTKSRIKKERNPLNAIADPSLKPSKYYKNDKLKVNTNKQHIIGDSL